MAYLWWLWRAIYRRADRRVDRDAHIENLCIYRLYMYYICMYRGIDVSQVKYARIENVCIYRRADYTGSTIYV